MNIENNEIFANRIFEYVCHCKDGENPIPIIQKMILQAQEKAVRGFADELNVRISDDKYKLISTYTDREHMISKVSNRICMFIDEMIED